MPELMEGDTLDEYALALLMRAQQHSNVTTDASFDFALPQSKALAECLGGTVPDELAAYVGRVRRRLEDIDRLSDDQVTHELELTRLRMRRRALLERKRSLTMLMVDADESERRGVMTMLSEVARDIQSIDEQLLPSERERVGAR